MEAQKFSGRLCVAEAQKFSGRLCVTEAQKVLGGLCVMDAPKIGYFVLEVRYFPLFAAYLGFVSLTKGPRELLYKKVWR